MKLVIAVLITAFVLFKLLPDEASIAARLTDEAPAPSLLSRDEAVSSRVLATQQPSRASAQSGCDGRQYCSQMSSCAEAKYFLRNCPGVKMDGDGDGIPCEEQWCGSTRLR